MLFRSDDLQQELDLWAEGGLAATFWWRDDDAEADTDALQALLRLQESSGVPLAIAAIGGLVTGILLLVGQHSLILVAINFAGAAAIGMVGIIAVYELDWNLM